MMFFKSELRVLNYVIPVTLYISISISISIYI